MLTECQIAWIQMRYLLTRLVIGMQAVCVWYYGRNYRAYFWTLCLQQRIWKGVNVFMPMHFDWAIFKREEQIFSLKAWLLETMFIESQRPIFALICCLQCFDLFKIESTNYFNHEFQRLFIVTLTKIWLCGIDYSLIKSLALSSVFLKTIDDPCKKYGSR